METRAYVFERARDVVHLIQGLQDAGQELSLLMTDRTAEREFSVSSRFGSDVPLALGEQGTKLSLGLHPLAALGGPGTGLVGVGSALEYLHGTGLGSYRDLPSCLATCGLGREDVQAALQAVRQGGVLVLSGNENEREKLKEHARELTLQFPPNAVPTGAPILAPVAPAPEQRAEYTPAVTPTGDVSRNWEER